jgi:hypothetical protein
VSVLATSRKERKREREKERKREREKERKREREKGRKGERVLVQIEILD